MTKQELKQEFIDRVKANFPQELQKCEQWVTWRAEPNPGKPKPKKVLFNPRTGNYGNSTDPAMWGTFEEACNAYLKGNYTGVGFVFSDGDPYTGVDLDNCITDGVIEPQRLQWVQSLNSYTEKSPSQKGLHIIVRGVLPTDGRKNPKLDVEMYDSERYFTVTGDCLDNTPPAVHSRQKQLEAFHREIFPQHYQSTATATQPAKPSVNIPCDDEALWKALFRKSNGASIRKLKDGDLSEHANDHSSADMALCNHLAWVTGKDAARIDRMFRQSALVRDKWEREDYRTKTIDKAIANTPSTYDPNYRSGNDDGWNGGGSLDDALMGVEMVAHTQHTNGNSNGKMPLPTVATKQAAAAAMQAALADDDEDEDDSAPTNAAQPQQQAQAAQQSAPPLTRSQKIKDILSGNGWSFRLNTLDNAVEVNGDRLSDIDESLIITYVRDTTPPKAKISKEEVRDVINVMAHENQYHPIREYLDGLVWDGKDHIAELSRYFVDGHDGITYANGKKLPVFYVFFSKWMISVVAKTYAASTVAAQSPMLVLSGAQDMGKSTFVRWLASGRLSYYNESDIKPESEDHKRLLATKWIWEVGELGATTRKADVESLKHFLTMVDATFRVPYGRYHLRKPALASFVGTVNPDKVRDGFLADNTGNRRFLTIELKSVKHAYEKTLDPNQLWAQAVAQYKQGVDWRLNATEKAVRDRINGGNMIKEPVADWLFKYFDIDPAEDWEMPVSDIVDLLQERGVKDNTKSLQMAVSKVLVGEGLRKNESARPRTWIGIKCK